MALLLRDVVPSDIVSDKDQGAVLTVAAAFCATNSLLFFCVRLLIRWPWKVLIGRDDLATTAATVSAGNELYVAAFIYADGGRQAFGVIQLIVTLQAVSQGLGRVRDDLSDGAVTSVQQVCEHWSPSRSKKSNL